LVEGTEVPEKTTDLSRFKGEYVHNIRILIFPTDILIVFPSIDKPRVKGVIVIVVCYMYAIFLFITAALCAQIFKGIKSSCEYNLLTTFRNISNRKI
jgi:hypothetical protein